MLFFQRDPKWLKDEVFQGFRKNSRMKFCDFLHEITAALRLKVDTYGYLRKILYRVSWVKRE